MYRIASIRIKEGREGGRLFVAVGRFELLVGLLALFCVVDVRMAFLRIISAEA